DPAADIVLMGDLNDEPGDDAVHDLLDAREHDPSAPFNHRLINTAAPVITSDTIGSYYFQNDWETIDQIMLSRGILDNVGLTLMESVETDVAPKFLRDRKAGVGAAPPFRTFKGRFYIGGTSDHFPVLLQVGWEK